MNGSLQTNLKTLVSAPQSYTRVPSAVYDALRRGDISPTQFLILAVLHARADWATGTVQGWSAEQFRLAMGNSAELPDLRTIRRNTQRLRMAGWFHDDYKHGSKRPYTVWLHNYVPLSFFVRDRDAGSDGDRDESVLNPCEIKPCSDIQLDGDREAVGDDCMKLSVNTQYAQSPRGLESQGTRRTSKSVAPPDPRLDELANLIYLRSEVPLVDSERKGLQRLMKSCDFAELKAALMEYLPKIDSNKKSGVRRFLLNGGAESVMTARRNRTPKEAALADCLTNSEWQSYL